MNGKKLTKISFTKAQYLSNAVSVGELYELGKYLDLNLGYLTNYSQSLLNNRTPHLVINRLARHSKCLTNPDKVHDILRIVEDTTMIADEIGYTVNHDWSLKRWQEEHNIVTRKRRAQEFSDKPIERGVYPNLLREVVSDKGDRATLLENPLALALEGDNMGHCVAGYASRCVRGEYVVYHILLGDGTIGTLGCVVYGDEATKTEQLRYQQCYGKYNDRINTEFAMYVVEQVNKALLETKERT
jgi:hypothetical protein